MRKFLISMAAMAAIATPLATQQAAAAEFVMPFSLTCLPREVMLQTLEQRYGETQVFSGISNDQKTLYEVFVSENGTFTITSHTTRESMVKDLVCIVFVGNGFELSSQEPLPVGDPA